MSLVNLSIEDKLVIGIASSALFDLSESDALFQREGEEGYRKYQKKNREKILKKGVAFPFIRRFLNLNASFPKENPVEVVLLSKNDPETGLRVFRSIEKYGLDISRAAFTSGRSPFSYLPAFNVSLFLSANEEDVEKAIGAGLPAGTVLPSLFTDDEEDNELRVAFDFDGVIADDSAEVLYKKAGLDSFQKHETVNSAISHTPGPLADLFKKLSAFQKLEKEMQQKDKGYKRLLRTAIVTARSAPAHERVVTTLNEWGVSPDETFFLGGVDKSKILEIMKPQIFFDDQKSHLFGTSRVIPSVHVPFGIANLKCSATTIIPE